MIPNVSYLRAWLGPAPQALVGVGLCKASSNGYSIPGAILFEMGSGNFLHRPRFGLDCTIGRRLAEEYALMSHLADICGLQEEINRGVGCKTFGEHLRADLTLTLVALTSQVSPWEARPGTGINTNQASHFDLEGFVHRIYYYEGSLYVDPSASPVIDFLYAIESAGISIKLPTRSSVLGFAPDEYFSSLPTRMEGIRQTGHQAWYESREYSRILKTTCWWP